MRNRYEHDSEPSNGGAKAIGWLFFIGGSSIGCGVEYALLQYAIEKSEGSGLIAYIPVIAVGLVGLVLSRIAYNNLNSTDFGIDPNEFDN